MAARRLAQETFDAVLQEKAKRFHMDAGAEAVAEALPFKAQDLLRTVPRSRADLYDDVASDARYSLSAAVAHPRDPGREGLRGDVFPGPSFRPSIPSASDELYFRKECAQDLEFSLPDSRDPVFGHRKLGPFRPQDWKFALRGSWEQDFGQPVSQEPSWPQEFNFAPSSILGDFGSSRLVEKECLEKEAPAYDAGEAEAVLRAGGQAQARARLPGGVDPEGGLLAKGEPQGLLKAKADVGKLVALRAAGAKKLAPMNRVAPKAPAASQLQKATPSPDVALGTNPGTEEIQFPAPKLPLGLDLKSIRVPRRKMSFDLVDKSDVFARFGIEIIKWAGFHTIKDDVRFSQLFQTLFELETETCAKMLASFKCSLRPEHREFCFFTIKFLKHSALKTPRVDNEFLNMLLDKGAVKTKNCFFEIIKPFDKYIMRLQDRLLKSVTPLLMACNAYELSVKMKTLSSPLDVAVALETTNSLCRKSLALLGQTFSLASSFRQEKILEAVGLQDIAPSPAAFPNFEDSTLFGREYIDHLKAWLVSSGCPLQVRRAAPAPTPAREEEPAPAAKPEAQTPAPGGLGDVPQRADRKVVETIDKLAKRVAEGSLSPKERALLQEDPTYWFLSDEESLEHKYYKLKLAETQRRRQAPPGDARPPSSAECAVRAMLYARSVRSLKRKLLPGRRRGPLAAPGLRGWRARRATTGTQTLLSSGARLRPHGRQAPGAAQPRPAKPDGGDAAKDCPPPPAAAPPRHPSPEAADPAPLPAGGDGAQGPATASASPSADVDAKTMETAEKLARFVAQVGPEIEQFSIENSTDNPDLWFLHDQSSPAFKFYRQKVFELCPSISFPPPPPAPGARAAPRGGARGPAAGGAASEGEPSRQDAPESPEAPPEDEDDDEDEEGARGEASAPRGARPGGAAARPERSPPADGPRRRGPAGAPALAPAQGGACFPRKRVSSKSLRVGLIPAPKRVCLIQEPKVHEPVRIAYDRPRGRPMSKKKKPKDYAFTQQKLTDKNRGFQMLQRMGWQEGRGLGSCGEGIREPVGVGTPSEGEGLGADGQEPQEDTFDVFRQRMMQMYRHKRASK
ncbi:SURP and G-patch domain-containing protein 2 [Dasypus novemcinctus]|uniref:SURP and G-patch domain-containing protein 2 n=1 Tax=Dasypus novemcinctus TaxID=9361 RepID=UPI00265F59E3|nr:SURP and G-patch domain-containing protein 2 [Dasypus novemcinctus]XP_058148786.1 SURP and G-patch domain-containing protein 2 [Dasypus novemcinctus]XP_058148787.1 SURP and G-patch domain-containing protein 2 [Dasypus novemcinctus]